jgi:hypothetical protein
MNGRCKIWLYAGTSENPELREEVNHVHQNFVLSRRSLTCSTNFVEPESDDHHEWLHVKMLQMQIISRKD